MSLRSEYFADVESIEQGECTLFVLHKGREIARERCRTTAIGDRSNQIISAHMEKVTRILEGGPIDPDKASEHDLLAHKADHDNQCEKDRE